MMTSSTISVFIEDLFVWRALDKWQLKSTHRLRRHSPSFWTAGAPFPSPTQDENLSGVSLLDLDPPGFSRSLDEMEKVEMQPVAEEDVPPPPPKVTFDDILATVGNFGRYQKLVVFLVILPMVLPSGFLSMSSVFFGATPLDYWCNVPENTSTPDRWISKRNTSVERKVCHMYTLDDSPNSNLSSVWVNNSGGWYKEENCEFGYEFDRSAYNSTVVTEWDLVCEDRTKATLTFTMFTVGGVIGPLISGYLADRFGRRMSFFLCIAFQSIFAIATAFSPSYIWFYFFRMMVGMTSSATFTVPFVLLLEITGPQHRALFSVLSSVTYTIGSLIFLGIAYLIRDWRTLALATSLTALGLYCSLCWFFPESPRWLLSRRRLKELEEYLRKVARINRIELTPQFDKDLPLMLQRIDQNENSRRKNHSVLDLFRTPNMRKKTLILIFLNICNKGVSMGLNLYAPLFSSNPHQRALLNSVVEFIPYIFAKSMFNRLGRRLSLFLGLSVGAICCLSTYAVPKTLSDVTLVLTLIAKFCITFTYLGGKLFEDETFPTVVRGEGHSLVSVLSSSISCGVPFIVDLGHNFTILPLLIFGSLCFVAALLLIFLPETANFRLPQTMSDGESFGKNMTWTDRLRLLPLKPAESLPVVNGTVEEREELAAPKANINGATAKEVLA